MFLFSSLFYRLQSCTTFKQYSLPLICTSLWHSFILAVAALVSLVSLVQNCVYSTRTHHVCVGVGSFGSTPVCLFPFFFPTTLFRIKPTAKVSTKIMRHHENNNMWNVNKTNVDERHRQRQSAWNGAFESGHSGFSMLNQIKASVFCFRFFPSLFVCVRDYHKHDYHASNIFSCAPSPP